MNKLNKIFAGIFILSGVIFLGSCVKGDFDKPEIIVPHFTPDTTLTTIPQLIAMHTPGGLETITKNIIVQGVVVANDSTGNFYKQIIIEDEVAGLQIQIEQKLLYTTYKLGQRVFIKCKGLSLGEYGGNMQLGFKVSGVIGRIPADSVESHIFLEGFPEAVPEPILVTIPTLTPSKLNMLLRLENIHFDPSIVGQPFSTVSATTNRNMLDENSNVLILRTSNYATFQPELIPTGTGYQFFIRDMNDLQGFTQ